MTRARLLAVAQATFAVLVVGAVGLALARNWAAVAGPLRRIAPGTVAAALGLSLLSPVTTMLAWRALLADLGSPLPTAPASSVFFVGQLGKYLPGSVWTVVAQTQMGRRLGVPRSRLVVAGVLSLALGVLAGVLVGLPSTPALVRASGTLTWVVVGVVAVGALVVLRPRVLAALIARGLRLLGRPPLEHDLTGRVLAVVVGWSAVAWLAMGASALLLARAVDPGAAPGTLALLCLSGYPLAGVLGMFAVIAPAGVGVRDGVLGLLLAAVLPVPAATAVVVVARFLTVVADVVVAGVGWLWGRRHDLLGGEA